MCVISSSDGVNWTGNTDTGHSSGAAMSLTPFNGQLYCAFVTNDGRREVRVMSSPDGVNWTHRTTGEACTGTPALAPFNDQLYCVFATANDPRDVLVISSADGVNWTLNARTGQASERGLALAVL